MDYSILECLSVYEKSSRKGAKIAKDAKLLLVILSLYFQDFTILDVICLV
jgi:hypothetical protein